MNAIESDAPDYPQLPTADVADCTILGRGVGQYRLPPIVSTADDA